MLAEKTVGKEKKNVWSTIQKREEFVFPYITIMTFKKMIIPMNLTGNKKNFFRILGNALLKRWSKQSINGVDVKKC